MEGAVQITMEIMVVQDTIQGMEGAVRITMEIMVVQATIQGMEGGVQITTAIMVGQAITPADRVTMATMGTVAVGTTLGAAQVSLGDQGGTQGPRSTGKWSVPLSELSQWW